jgi:RNA polymerase sigma-70 factor (ECF subfamily)
MATTTADAPSRPRTYTDDSPTANDRLWALVAQIQGADGNVRDPLGELYRATYPTVFHYVRSKVRTYQTAEDLTSDVYERAVKRIGGLRRQASSPAAWLITIAHNRVADHYKSGAARLTILMDEVHPRTAEGRPEYVGAPDTTANAVLADHDSIALRAAFGRLTEEQREAMRLRYLVGLSIAETAELLGKPCPAVKSMTYRATRALAGDPELAATRCWLAAA